MRSLIFLTFLAFLAGTLVFVAAANAREGIIVSYVTTKGEILNVTEEEFVADDSECPHDEEEKCAYKGKKRLSCYCRPPLFGHTRLDRFFYSPEHNRCFMYRGLGHGCNSFENIDECWSNCTRGRRPGKKIKHNKKKIN
uniref:Putative secreted protein n=1 Tax=Amblyomma cajennense TaxID=34607 RepID=A0A023FFD4_AMBCJ